MWFSIKRLLRDDSGNTYVEYVILSPVVAVLMIALFEALYGQGGDNIKQMTQDVAFAYADGFEGGLSAPGPYWTEQRPDDNNVKDRAVNSNEIAIGSTQTEDLSESTINIDTIMKRVTETEPVSVTGPTLSVPGWILPLFK